MMLATLGMNEKLKHRRKMDETYEYFVMTLRVPRPDGYTGTYTHELNEMGQKGWRLVSVGMQDEFGDAVHLFSRKTQAEEVMILENGSNGDN